MMSVSDPLLKLLKGHIIELRSETEPVLDNHPHLRPLCQTLELILRKGIRGHSSLFGFTKRDYWHWIEDISGDRFRGPRHRVNPIFDILITAVKECRKVTTAQGRGRLFIRLSLQRKIFCIPIDLIARNPHFAFNCYDPLNSILGNDILREILLSCLFELTEINFRLCTRSMSFLEDTWQIPIYKEIELVPCTDLGIQAHHYNGRVIVASLDEDGVAGDTNELEPGDILDEIQREPMRNIVKGKIPKIMRQHQGAPINLAVIKCKLSDGSIFPPILHLLRAIGHECPVLQRMLQRDQDQQRALSKEPGKLPLHAQLPEDLEDEIPVHSEDAKAEYELTYIAKAVIGKDGGVHQIEGAIEKVLDLVNPDQNPHETKAVHFETGETNVIVKDLETKQTLFTHSYTAISSCGRRTDNLLYFAYIAGETTCTIAKDFVAYVFKSKSPHEAKTILCSIAQGFGRTHWFV